MLQLFVSAMAHAIARNRHWRTTEGRVETEANFIVIYLFVMIC